ncbi:MULTISPECIES: hypothetical protein [unclassified Sinorhizobium]|uniref:hypothetical protein n=1 Tax=unclassified Sinorhizobium TaxID=2613772 RepID=UPI003523BAF8
MSANPERLFDFSPYLEHLDFYRDLVKQFAAHDAFRSAEVEELELDEDFYRRPLRPEDLDYIKFKRAVTPDRISLLPSLAGQRMLLCINELDVARLPKEGSEKSFEEFHRFYGGDGRILAARIRPFLENYVFSHLAEPFEAADIDGYVSQLADHLRSEATEWNKLFELLQYRDYVEEGLRFIFIQRWSLLPAKRAALAKAAAAGYFDILPEPVRPTFSVAGFDDALMRKLADRVGVTKREHSYWQFYLSTSLAGGNLLHSFAARPDRALSLYGAAFAAEAEFIAFGCVVGQGLARLSMMSGDQFGLELPATIESITQRFRTVLIEVERLYGARGVAEVAQGFVAARRLAACAWDDLLEQMRWISAVEQYRDIAKSISERIEAERPDIDRETFIEPREMCSTTHVHNDHRLVVIQSGDMVFWANLGMKLRMKPGEMVFVPKGRLHGSSIESDECTYHQPIIPPEWIEPLVNEVQQRKAAAE